MKKYSTQKLSDPEVRHAKPQDKLYRLRDGGGLYCEVLVTGAKTWRYNYRFDGKQKTFTIGSYPDVSLSEARALRDKAKNDIKNKIDPSQRKQLNKQNTLQNNFQAIAQKWMNEQKPQWSKSHYDRIKSYLTKDVFPFIGSRDVSTIEAPEIISIILKVSDRGSVNAARRVKGFIQQVFDYGVAHAKTSRNPAKDVNLAMVLPKTIKRHYASIKDPNTLSQLLRTIDEYHGTIQVKAALRLFPLLMVRPTELTSAEWCEFDLEKAVWTIPAKRRKLPQPLKDANSPDDAHIVALSRQALNILEELKPYTGKGDYLFPSVRTKTRPITNDTIRTALRAMGFDNNTITAHGFRGVASTFLHTLGYRTEVIEAQLAHKDKNTVRSAYNHADYLVERKTMLQEWADYLDNLKVGAEIIPIGRNA